MITLLDYGAGNVRSVINAIEKLGERITVAKTGRDIRNAEKLVFPGVGNFGSMMYILRQKQFVAPLLGYLGSGRPFLGICVGMQALFEGSDEAPAESGLGILPGRVQRFDVDLPVPHIGWNDLDLAAGRPPPPMLERVGGRRDFTLCTPTGQSRRRPTGTGWPPRPTMAAPSSRLSRKGSVCATQFHPEKSRVGPGWTCCGASWKGAGALGRPVPSRSGRARARGLARRVIACLDVRANDAGDLVVTKGDQYDVREGSEDDEQERAPGASGASGDVRNLGKPVDLARRYYEEGADEVTFLNITGFRESPLGDLPMLEVLRRDVGGCVRAADCRRAASGITPTRTARPTPPWPSRPSTSGPGRTRCPSAATRWMSSRRF